MYDGRPKMSYKDGLFHQFLNIKNDNIHFVENFTRNVTELIL